MTVRLCCQFLGRFFFIGSQSALCFFEARLKEERLKEKYMTITEYILKEASKLTPIEKAQLIDKLISIRISLKVLLF
jgi:hypothetical protein